MRDAADQLEAALGPRGEGEAARGRRWRSRSGFADLDEALALARTLGRSGLSSRVNAASRYHRPRSGD